jgi:hypothetical protein
MRNVGMGGAAILLLRSRPVTRKWTAWFRVQPSSPAIGGATFTQPGTGCKALKKRAEPCNSRPGISAPFSLCGEWQSPHIAIRVTRYLPCAINRAWLAVGRVCAATIEAVNKSAPNNVIKFVMCLPLPHITVVLKQHFHPRRAREQIMPPAERTSVPARVKPPHQSGSARPSTDRASPVEPPATPATLPASPPEPFR